MVEEVVPFFERFVTPSVSTEKLLDYALRTGILKLKYQVVSGLGYLAVLDFLC